jgi:hypothetical protein
MAENSDGVMVTEGMLAKAARGGDLESLAIWAWRGARVTSGRPLCIAAWDGNLEVVQILVRELGANANQTSRRDTPLLAAAHGDYPAVIRCLIELGADVNHALQDGRTPLHIAAHMGNLAVVRCLVEEGASVGAVNRWGDTPLLESAHVGYYSIMQYLLEEADATMDDVNSDRESSWDRLLLMVHMDVALNDDGKIAALIGLLRVLVLRGALPPALVDLLSPEPARVVQEGARLRARLPAYLAHRRAYLNLRCSRISRLPGVLRALIYTFEGPATTEELWATGLGQAP